MKNVKLETYLTIRELADYLRLNEQTIQRWVMCQEVPYHKIKKVIRFRVSEIEKWITDSGWKCPNEKSEDTEGFLFGDDELAVQTEGKI
jgi:excisionase family DNA binding protein